MARRTKCGAIMGVFPDEIFLAAAYLAARRCRVTFYPYYHNTVPRQPEGLGSLASAAICNRVRSRTRDTVFVMSEGMQVSWERLYPGVRFEPLTHTFRRRRAHVLAPSSASSDGPHRISRESQ